MAGTFLLTTVACGGERRPPLDRRLPGVEFGPWQLEASRPVLSRGDSGNWDDGLIDPGAMVFHSGRFHSLYNAIRSWPSPLGIGYATSIDGISWERQTTSPVFQATNLEESAWSVRATSAIVEADEWILIFSVIEQEGTLHGRIGRATAPSPLGPWRVDSLPVLEAGAGGAWTAQAVGDAKLVPVAEGYVLYFTAIDGSGVRRIGRASSRNMSIWTVHPTPALDVGASGEWDALEVSDPSVARTPDGGWVMVYRGRGERGTGLGWASSSDGIGWEKAGEPFVRSWEHHAWNTVYFSALVPLQERHHVYFEASDTPSGGTQVYHAWRDVSIAR